MSTKVIMPQMGESIFEGTLTKWLKKVGDAIDRDEPLFEISTDKVDSEIPAPAAGMLKEILVAEGETVQINTVVAIIEGEEGPTSTEEKKEASPPDIEVKPAEMEEQPEPPLPVAEIAQDEPGTSPPRAKGEPKPAVEVPRVQPRDIRTSPLVRRMAREHNIDLSTIAGTGQSGRITKQDILNYLDAGDHPSVADAEPVRAKIPEPATTGETEAPESVPAPPRQADAGADQVAEIVPMSAMRKAIAEHMVLSKKTSAHVHTVFQVDMTEIVKLRDSHKKEFEAREGIKLTYTPFFVKALVDTVREFPIVNSSVGENTVVIKKPINVGVAVALEAGLIVPVVKDAQLKSFTGIVLAIHDLAERARTKRLVPEDVQDGTISITNPGVYGAQFGTPIISQPQVAILGVGGLEKRPVVINDAIAIRSMIYLTLSFDHRVIDGAVADQFMAALKKRLETWNKWVE